MAINDWELVIGLEIHAQIASESKLFSSSSARFSHEANVNVSFIDVAMPGMLPVLNRDCVKHAVRTGIALNAEINRYSVFARKNYFYPDLPQGYQISQYEYPIIGKGKLEIEIADGIKKEVGVTRIHMEQDAGKSFHDQSPTETYVDLNRAGVGLMEIVTDPDMRSSKEAGEFMKKLRSILRYVGACDGDMENGSLRCDANVSVRKKGSEAFGNRVEVKNLNSIKNVMRAIEFEKQRQVELLESGEIVKQETRLFDADTGATRAMRDKENVQDYRYFSDPDLLPLILDENYVEHIRASLPELPDQKRKRYVEDIGLSTYDADVLSIDKEVAQYFEDTISFGADPKAAANWITGELFGRLNKHDLNILQCSIKPEEIAELLSLIKSEVISGKIAKHVFDVMFATGKKPGAIVEDEGLTQVTDSSDIEAFIDQVLKENKDKVAEYKAGKEKLLAFFIGQVMKVSKGRLNPNSLQTLLIEKLKKF
ncbi:Asp-tRNA(Asn)/Glu-tRNA(Gln) amidotransferase subunit GatB [Rickettsiales endosymbiont of Peranema trichophorum]|uniref:Asp-tRNA(Asn)/Glu-tRNA(Gln) amidotransferase subunit GatB n=1 Tax=Rickettsiales endosymbiont of Peranema trichophorum TaxID=2486577 RepID=UPI001023BE64|nr:Asp-tRNA(Asn)/Glu-tRNA(Gln) amidotransferase subunit GatB [Rickettsiales endosymbiont of Peranema trichophorum]RZI47214.1 Asp-tRNA(Asn)/Glu-tRNA(Gln) amidotransferase subunit GatB [Rickettsiales endosymbiont of Peranema trichophorum]